MALGLGVLLGLRLPLNFNSPLRATSAIEFWQRWHISLSQWLRDYLYIPLGGDRGGAARTHLNLLLTMLLGGLWHGANWTFVIWGALHGLYLIVERLLPKRLLAPSASPAVILIRLLVTFHLTCLAWVFFRAQTFEQALQILVSMTHVGQFDINTQIQGRVVYVAAAGMALVAGWFSICRGQEPRVEGRGRALADGLMLAAIVLFPGDRNAFIYFQF